MKALFHISFTSEKDKGWWNTLLEFSRFAWKEDYDQELLPTWSLSYVIHIFPLKVQGLKWVVQSLLMVFGEESVTLFLGGTAGLLPIFPIMVLCFASLMKGPHRTWIRLKSSHLFSHISSIIPGAQEMVQKAGVFFFSHAGNQDVSLPSLPLHGPFEHSQE